MRQTLRRIKLMSKIKIAIIDSGVRLDHPALRDSSPQIVHYSESNDMNASCGHGTAVYNIIRKTEDFADIINFQITNEDEEICYDTLISCLTEIRDHYDVNIINLSLGLSVCENTEELRRICDDLNSKGVIIVSAFENFGAISYPAAFNNVIGVTSIDICRKVDDFVLFDDEIINIGANGNLQRLAWDVPDYIIFHGNSFACAHTTVQVAKFMIQGASTLDEIMDCFNKIALKASLSSGGGANVKYAPKIKTAAIFPFNKEMHSLIRFCDLLPFEINGVYDVRESSRVGSTTDHIMKADVKSFIIKNIDEMDWNSCDTIIVGNIPNSSVSYLSTARDAVIKKAISLSKNIFSFDDIKDKYNYKGLFCPIVDSIDVPPMRLGKLYRISKPVIGIYGTSSSQGKFTLQLELRKKFKEQDYIVGQIGTEPSSNLFGIEYTYPMGFNSSVYIDGHNAISYINECIHNLCDNNCDVVITGSQASVLPIDTGNLTMYPMKQYSFLMGTQPDCMILCINPDDDLDYIRRSIMFLESSVAGKVIALCMYPMKYRDGWTRIHGQKETLNNDEFVQLKERLYEEFSIPIYLLGKENDISLLFDDIVSFFSA